MSERHHAAKHGHHAVTKKLGRLAPDFLIVFGLPGEKHTPGLDQLGNGGSEEASCWETSFHEMGHDWGYIHHAQTNPLELLKQGLR